MRIIAALSLLIACAPAHAAPPCWPKQIGSTGSDYKIGQTADGKWLAWTCVVKGKPEVFAVWAVSGWTSDNMTTPNTTGLTPVKAARAFWDANVRPSNDPRHARLFANARASFPP